MKDDEDVLVGSSYSSSNNSQYQYVKCGFCSDFYLKVSSLHSCYLKKRRFNIWQCKASFFYH